MANPFRSTWLMISYIYPRNLSLWVNTFLLLDGWLREKMDSERQETFSKPVKKRKGPVTKTELVIHKSIFRIASTIHRLVFAKGQRGKFLKVTAF